MVLLLLACTSPTPEGRPPPIPAPTLGTLPGPVTVPEAPPPGWSAVRPIVERRCAGCHTEGGGAPFPIVSAADAADSVWAALDGLMPPARFDPACRSTVDQRWLPAEELATLAAWQDAGSPDDDGVPAVPQPSTTAPEPSGEPQLAVDIGEDYVPAPGWDETVVFTPSFAFAATTFVSAARVVVGAPGVVHHVTVFVVDEAGVPVFGDAYADSPTNALAAWAPGQPPWVLPEGAAFVVPAGGRLRFEIHYSTVALAGAPAPADRTRLELWTLDEPPTDYAFMVPFVLTGFTIPAGDPAYTLTEEGGYGGPDATIVGITPHAHLRATAARMWRIRPDGTEDCLADLPNFDFGQQALHWYTPDDRVEVEPTDLLRIACTWDNSAANQPVVGGVALPVADLHEGPGTFDEMCQLGWLVVRPYGE